jgi:hypothetical protein
MRNSEIAVPLILLKWLSTGFVIIVYSLYQYYYVHIKTADGSLLINENAYNEVMSDEMRPAIILIIN